MIGNDAGKAFDGLAARIAVLAKALGEARGRSRVLARRGDPVRWRRSALLWPTFTGD